MVTLEWDGPVGRGAPPPEEFVEHREAEPAGHDRGADRPDDEDVLVEAHEVVAEQREAGVVEGRHRVEQTLPQGRPDRMPVADVEPQRQEDGDDDLGEHDGDTDGPQDALDVAHRRCAGLALRDEVWLKPRRPPARIASKVAIVMMPKPPTWMSTMMTNCPKVDQ